MSVLVLMLAMLVAVLLPTGVRASMPRQGEEPTQDGSWALIDTWTAAPGRAFPLTAHRTAWDPDNERMLVFGGLALHTLNYLWSYRPADFAWTRLGPTTPVLPGHAPKEATPAARFWHSAVWDAQNRQLLVFGGFGETAPLVLDDLWSYRPASNAWIELKPTDLVPAARAGHTAVWDPVRAQMLVFGGQGVGNHLLSDLWAYQPFENRWLELRPQGRSPAARSHHSAVWDASAGQLLVFGGNGGSQELWSYRATENTWTELAPDEPRPVGRERHTAVWDPVRQQMLLWGGARVEIEQGVQTLGDLWSYRPAANAWTPFMPAGGTPAALSASAAWDASTGQMLLYGGTPDRDARSDLWAYRPTEGQPSLHSVAVPSSRPTPPITEGTQNTESLFAPGWAWRCYNGTKAVIIYNRSIPRESMLAVWANNDWRLRQSPLSVLVANVEGVVPFGSGWVMGSAHWFSNERSVGTVLEILVNRSRGQEPLESVVARQAREAVEILDRVRLPLEAEHGPASGQVKTRINSCALSH